MGLLSSLRITTHLMSPLPLLPLLFLALSGPEVTTQTQRQAKWGNSTDWHQEAWKWLPLPPSCSGTRGKEASLLRWLHVPVFRALDLVLRGGQGYRALLRDWAAPARWVECNKAGSHGFESQPCRHELCDLGPATSLLSATDSSFIRQDLFEST